MIGQVGVEDIERADATPQRIDRDRRLVVAEKRAHHRIVGERFGVGRGRIFGKRRPERVVDRVALERALVRAERFDVL